MSGLTRSLQGINPVRLLILLGIVGLVVGFFFYLATRLIEPPMGLLFGDLDPGDSSKIVTRLEGMNVPYELRAGGSQIFVPSDQTLRLRMAMAGENLPRGGSVGYEVFDNTDSLGATRTMQNINLLRALEGELARTIGALSPIAAARVHLVLPKRALFNRDRTEPSASIVVTHEPGSRLNKAQVIAVQNLVAAAVPGLKVSRISIVDNDGTLLARSGNGEDDPALATLEAQDRRAAIETRLKNTIEELLERSVGVGKVRAEVNAEVDFDHITTVEEIYDPDGQVARSIQSVEEEGSSSEQDAANDVSVANSLPDANVTQTPGARAANSTTRTEETTNFEISKTVRNHIRESGTIKRLSVAVLVDGVYTTDANGERTYQPRGDQEMQKLAALVRSAIGFDEKRGDTLELANMQFSTVEAPEPIAPPLFNLGKGDYFKIAEIAVLFIVGLLVILLVLRPLATQLLSPPSRGAFAGEGGAQAALPPAGETAQIAAQPEGEESDIDIENVEGRVKHSTIKKVGEIVDNHPDEALGIIRNWLYQEA